MNMCSKCKYHYHSQEIEDVCDGHSWSDKTLEIQIRSLAHVCLYDKNCPQMRDPVTGHYNVINLPICSTKNHDGGCPDFAPWPDPKEKA